MTQILSGVQFTGYFIEFVVVETKQFVDSTLNVILMWQICGCIGEVIRFVETKQFVGSTLNVILTWQICGCIFDVSMYDN